MEEKERKEKANKLFDKGMECYNNQQYKEALKYFEASIKFYKNDRAELFIGVCKNNIPEEDKKNNNSNNTSSNNYNKEYSYSKPSSSSSNYSSKKSKSSSSSTDYSKNKSYSADKSEDKICKELLKKKDYYDILNIKKDATQEEIKRGYKKQAIKFHPDKNHSKLAEECFKKISEAYQCLSNPEKKNFYDKYGNEEEFKAKYYEANHRYYEEEMNPFEAFNMFFGNGFYPNAGRRHYYYTNNDSSEGENRNRRTILQFFPVLMLFLIYILPNLSYLFESKPLYQFTRNSTYNRKRRTQRNGVEFYVGDKFIKKYPKMKDFKFLEPTIEKEYLGYLYEDCSNTINYKNQLQYYMNSAYSNYQKSLYKRQLDQLNFSSCHKYNSLVNLIR